MQERIRQWLQIKRYNWRNYDFSLVVVVLILSLISSYILSIALPDDDFSLKRQAVALIGGLFVVFIFSIIDYHDLCLYIPIIYILSTLMAAATKFSPLGDDQSTGSYRWLDFKVIKFQPSEICKIVVILALATFFFRSREHLKSFKNFFIATAIAIVPTFFILIQSDLSSSVVIMVVLIMMLLCSGIGRKVLGPIAAVVLPVIAFLFWYIQQPSQILLHGYQLERIMGWLHPETEALGVMYQQNNSILSIASGRLYGKLLEGTEMSRNYTSVDVIESDFIWAPISEEFGFIGCIIILALLSIIIIKCFFVAKNAKDYLGMMIAIGISSMICFQTFFNVGVATSLLPNTGLPLPFLSNGLTSLLSNMMTIGILLNIGIQPNRGSNSSFEIR
ncbi:MAG: FtsW/RodA/SpoVE family cell cycle protein [Lachnospiraceae bacterium]|nr:FtsW/RodA/SpoVE family cell cycle protein [Lachnospiraceae bacterium]